MALSVVHSEPVRLACKDCDEHCASYEGSIVSLSSKCDFCGHKAGRHAPAPSVAAPVQVQSAGLSSDLYISLESLLIHGQRMATFTKSTYLNGFSGPITNAVTSLVSQTHQSVQIALDEVVLMLQMSSVFFSHWSNNQLRLHSNSRMGPVTRSVFRSSTDQVLSTQLVLSNTTAMCLRLLRTCSMNLYNLWDHLQQARLHIEDAQASDDGAIAKLVKFVKQMYGVVKSIATFSKRELDQAGAIVKHEISKTEEALHAVESLFSSIESLRLQRINIEYNREAGESFALAADRHSAAAASIQRVREQRLPSLDDVQSIIEVESPRLRAQLPPSNYEWPARRLEFELGSQESMDVSDEKDGSQDESSVNF